MKKVRYIFAILLCMLLCGCVKSNTSMVINEDKSMTITLDLMLNEYSRKNYGDLLNKRSDELKKEGFDVNTIVDEFYSGYSITKKYSNIDDTIYEGKNSIDISNFTDDDFTDKIFTVKKCIFYNTYYANFEFESLLNKYNKIIESNEKDANESEEEIIEEEKDFKGSEYTFSVSFPDRPLFSNANTISKDGKTLIWILNQTENSNVKFTFKMKNKNIIISTISIGISILVVLIIIIAKVIKKKHSISSDIKKDKPILKEYDPSIENKINNGNNDMPANIGVSAQPIIEIKEEPVIINEEPIIEKKEEPIIIEEPKPEVSTNNFDAKRLSNYEISLPEESMARKAMEYRNENPIKKEPLFVNNNIEEPVEEKPIKQEVIIDKPEAEDINSIL